MTLETSFMPHRPLPTHQLPATLMSLDTWVMVNVTGSDAEKYLQGQLTAHIPLLDEQHHVFCAHCDAKGKMWSNLRLFRRAGGFSYLIRRSVAENQIAELKKYAVFSKLTIALDQQALVLGIAGVAAEQALSRYFPCQPNENCSLVHAGETTLLYLPQPIPRYLLVTSPGEAEKIIQAMRGYIEMNTEKQWVLLDIEAGYPIIDIENTGQFIPQATNLQALGGIDFNKGCYSGQEMIARAKYRGINKRALYWLKGSGQRIPEAGEDLELRLGETWRRSGTILTALSLDDNTVYVQAILSHDLNTSTRLRIRNDHASQLTIQPLPYSLVED